MSFTAWDATSGIVRHEVSLDAGPGVAASSPFQIGPLADGVHSIEVTAFDRAGNSRTAGAGAFIDTVAPPAPLAFRGIEAAVVNCRFVKPVDLEVLARLRASCPVLVTVEENAVPGGFGDGVLDALGAAGLPLDGVVRLGLPDAFVSHGSRAALLEEAGLIPASLDQAVVRALAVADGGRAPVAARSDAD